MSRRPGPQHSNYRSPHRNQHTGGRGGGNKEGGDQTRRDETREQCLERRNIYPLGRHIIQYTWHCSGLRHTHGAVVVPLHMSWKPWNDPRHVGTPRLLLCSLSGGKKPPAGTGGSCSSGGRHSQTSVVNM